METVCKRVEYKRTETRYKLASQRGTKVAISPSFREY